MSRQPLQPALMRNGFTKVGDFYFVHPQYFNLCSPHQLLELFQPYYKYCAEQTSCQQYCKEQDRDNQVTVNIIIMHIKINITHIKITSHIKINITSAKYLDHDHLGQVFKAYLAWCETQRDCNRLRLVDILVRPMQRLTKYSLLLKVLILSSE